MRDTSKSLLSAMKPRPWSEFLEGERFKWPTDAEKWGERTHTNLLYYQGNYAMILGVCLLFAIISSPGLAVALVLILGCSVVLFVVFEGPISTGEFLRHHVITRTQKVIVTCVLSVGLVLYFSGLVVFWVIFVAALLIALHATLRVRSIKSKVNTFVNTFRGDTPLGSVLRQELMVEDSGPSGDEMPDEENEFLQRRRAGRKHREEVRAKYLRRKQ
eukprot:TRINITY_DN6189_c0_g1_i1.p1 TRINITY_DN6189_c0_g1~~TRINITY_DN6189_c0_g1_i1.p1  ORF type:complete len:216 (+),score=42.03 TRINITY_DN6189_c0_g1_i1:57-704(+)